jgi:hypothetical protein
MSYILTLFCENCKKELGKGLEFEKYYIEDDGTRTFLGDPNHPEIDSYLYHKQMEGKDIEMRTGIAEIAYDFKNNKVIYIDKKRELIPEDSEDIIFFKRFLPSEIQDNVTLVPSIFRIFPNKKCECGGKLVTFVFPETIDF